MSKSLKTLAKNLEEFRKRRNLSQDQLAELAKTTRNTVIRIEKGNGNPSLNVIDGLANALKVPTLALLDPDAIFEKYQKRELDSDLVDLIGDLGDEQKELALYIISTLATDDSAAIDLFNQLSKLPKRG